MIRRWLYPFRHPGKAIDQAADYEKPYWAFLVLCVIIVNVYLALVGLAICLFVLVGGWIVGKDYTGWFVATFATVAFLLLYRKAITHLDPEKI